MNPLEPFFNQRCRTTQKLNDSDLHYNNVLSKIASISITSADFMYTLNTNRLNLPVFAFLPVALTTFANASTDSERIQLDSTTVYAQETKPNAYLKLENESASIIPMSNQKTPQAMGTVTHAQLEDFNLNDISRALAMSNAVNIEQVEPARWYIRSRGFEVDRIVVDGVGGASIYGNIYGDIDVAAYDSIDVLRGSNGMMNVGGNPSASINLVRKMPTSKKEGKVKLIGDQDKGYRLDGDLSGSLSNDGSLRGRVVAAHASGDNYLDRYQPNKNVLYAVATADLNESLTLSLGHEMNDQNDDGVMWGSLAFLDNLNNELSYSTSQSSAPGWSTIENRKNNTFLKLDGDVGEWQIRAIAEHRKQTTHALWAYLYRSGNPLAPTELAVSPSEYKYNNTAKLVDLKLNRDFEWFGKSHALGLGVHWAKANTLDSSATSAAAIDPINNIKTWRGEGNLPTFVLPYDGSDIDQQERSVYFSSRFNLNNNLSLLFGGRYAEIDYSGVSYQVFNWNDEYEKFSPSLALSYQLPNSGTHIYASVNDIFQSQRDKDINNKALEPVEGRTHEIGLKQYFNNKSLLVSAALFKTYQDNLAQFSGMRQVNDVDIRYYSASDRIKSKGYEIDISGQLSDSVSINGGLANVRVDNNDGERIKQGIPTSTYTLGLSYTPSRFNSLRTGASLKWQSDTWALVGDQQVTQDAHGVINLFAEYAFHDQLSGKLNWDNVTNEKYWRSLYSAERYAVPQSYYGQPSTVSASLIYTF